MYGTWCITVDVRATRRKVFNWITDPQGEVQYKSREFWPCVHWLDERDILEYVIRPDEGTGPPNFPLRVATRREE